jgi:[acyl-carrier-protein] S-malonyltransferase
MSRKIAYIFPGQGSQYVGMGKDFYDSNPVAKAVFDEADTLLGSKFSELIFAGDPKELTLTKNSQLAIFIVSYALFCAVQSKCSSLPPTMTAGLSLGEYTALVAAGKISFSSALETVRLRASLMHQSCIDHPGSMSVVLGLSEHQIEEALTSSMLKDVQIANLNCPGQIVIAGTKDALVAAEGLLKTAGAKRVMPLDVSGAFHSALMKSARDGLSPYLEKLPILTTNIDVALNTPGDFVSDPEQIRKSLIAQVTEPVRWEQSIRKMTEKGVDLFIEVGCGKTLSGMNKRIGVVAPTISIEKIEDMNKLAEEYAHGTS